MVPLSVIMVPLYVVVNQLNLFNNLWGVILPTVATPTGVFLLRQYMLTIPDELIEAARMDHASEWKIYWRIVMPLCLRSEEHTSELQSQSNLVCRLLLEKKN